MRWRGPSRSSYRWRGAHEVAGWLASWPEFAESAPHALTPATAGDDRVVVLTGVDTKGLEFDGILVLDPDAIEAESPTGRVHAVRRPHPRHPAADPDPLTRRKETS